MPRTDYTPNTGLYRTDDHLHYTAAGADLMALVVATALPVS